MTNSFSSYFTTPQRNSPSQIPILEYNFPRLISTSPPTAIETNTFATTESRSYEKGSLTNSAFQISSTIETTTTDVQETIDARTSSDFIAIKQTMFNNGSTPTVPRLFSTSIPATIATDIVMSMAQTITDAALYYVPTTTYHTTSSSAHLQEKLTSFFNLNLSFSNNFRIKDQFNFSKNNTLTFEPYSRRLEIPGTLVLFIFISFKGCLCRNFNF